MNTTKASGLILLMCLVFSGLISIVSATTVTDISLLSTYTGTDPEEVAFKSGFKDDNGFVYFTADNTFPIKVFKYRASDLSYVATLSLDSGEEYPYSATAHNGFGYVGTWDGLGRVVKINLTDFTRVGVLDPTGNTNYVGAGVDTVNNFAYFSGGDGTIAKIDLSDFTVDSILTLTEDQLWTTPVIDYTNHKMYVVTYNAPAQVVKINLDTFTKESALTLNSGENNAYALALDPDSQTLYVGLNINSASKIVRVNAQTMTRTDATTYADTSIASNSMAYDTEFDKLYALGGTDNPVFFMVNPSDMTMEDSLTISPTTSYVDSTVYDLDNKLVYFGLYGTPAKIYKIQLYNEEADPTPAPAAEPASSSPRSGERSRPISLINAPASIAQTPSNTQTAVINLITQNKSLFTEALSQGIVIPQFILDILGVKGPTSGQVLVRDLSLGSVGEDVKMLQKILNSQGFAVSSSGEGSLGNETTIFGPLTREALVKYQTAKGISPASGIFGPLTRNQMKSAGIPGLWW